MVIRTDTLESLYENFGKIQLKINIIQIEIVYYSPVGVSVIQGDILEFSCCFSYTIIFE